MQEVATVRLLFKIKSTIYFYSSVPHNVGASQASLVILINAACL